MADAEEESDDVYLQSQVTKPLESDLHYLGFKLSSPTERNYSEAMKTAELFELVRLDTLGVPRSARFHMMNQERFKEQRNGSGAVGNCESLECAVAHLAFENLCGLQAIHQYGPGLWHGDIKPGNVGEKRMNLSMFSSTGAES